MMKRIWICLLMTTLLFSLAIVVGAETLPDDEALPEADQTETISAYAAAAASDSDESDDSSQVVLVPGEGDLPEGYIIDEDFYIEIKLTAEGGWTNGCTWEEILKQAIDDCGEYIYFVDEQNIPQGYIAAYSMVSTDLTDGNIIIIKNVKQGEPPVYELPETGGTGTTVYTVIGVAFLAIAAVYGAFLLRKRAKDAA